MLGYDDALDTFGVHAVGGTMGAFLTGCLAAAKSSMSSTVSNLADGGGKLDLANAATKNGLAKLVETHMLWVEQSKAIGVTLVLAVVGTAIIAFAVKAVIGLRPTEEVEYAGLDISEHGEEGYINEGGGTLVSHSSPTPAATHGAPAVSRVVNG